VTMLFNVPLNNALASAGELHWPQYLARWTRWNHVRTITSMGAAALFIAAIAGLVPAPTTQRGYSVSGISTIDSNGTPLAFAASSTALKLGAA